jgi:phosphatidylinositol alpha-1,6-mannosyltransferase
LALRTRGEVDRKGKRPGIADGHLIIATQNFPPALGGIERFSEDLALALSARWPRLTVLAPRQAGADAHDKDAHHEIVRYSCWPTRELGLARALWPRLDDVCAIVCMQWTSAIVPAIVLASRSTALGNRPLAIVGHGKELIPAAKSVLPRRLNALVRSRVLQAATHVLVNSAHTCGLAVKAGAVRQRVVVLHPGVDVERFRPRQSAEDMARYRDGVESPCLLTVSRLVPRKGVDTVIEALPTLRTRFPNILYLVAGDGPDRPRLETKARRLGVARCVRFLGRVAEEDLPSLYTVADLFVLVSRVDDERSDVEGFGMVLLEAQACATPVVTTSSGGMPDAIATGESGELVPASDPGALADTLTKLLRDPERLARMGRRAREKAESHTWSAVAGRLLSILHLVDDA